MNAAVIEFGMDHYAESVGFARRRGIPSRLAEDMVGDAFLNLLCQDREIECPKAYWFTTLRNVCNSYFRRVRETPLGEHVSWVLDSDRVYWQSRRRPMGDDPETAVISSEGAAAVNKIMQNLTPKEREALSMRIEGMEQPGVNGRVNLHRARRKLRQHLESIGA